MGTTKLSSTGFTNGDHASPIARLVAIGRKQSFVTVNDILRVIPYPELDIEQLEQVFAALMCAGISFIEEPEHPQEHAVVPLIDK
jgi:RNA polymerase primary sigma factor